MSWFHSEDISNSKDIIAELSILDELCAEKSIYTEFIIVGGALLIIILEDEGVTYRMTSDIDIARIRTNDEQTLDEILSRDLQERINTRVEGIMIPDATEILETDELEEFHHGLFKNIKPYIATPELLVVLKSISDRKIDMEDVLKSGLLGVVDTKRTIELIEEYKSFSPFSELPDSHWEEVVNELKKKL